MRQAGVSGWLNSR